MSLDENVELNKFASTYLDCTDSSILAGDKIISNGNCLFHALGYAYYASSQNTSHRDEPICYAVDKTASDSPSYNIKLDEEKVSGSGSEHGALLIINYYNDLNCIKSLKVKDAYENNYEINKSALKIKEYVAKTIIGFNKKYIETHPESKITEDKVTDQNEDEDEVVGLDAFIHSKTYDSSKPPTENDKLNDKYYYGDDYSIYASAFLLNKIICILKCKKNEGEPFIIDQYVLFGPKDMKCTPYNILFLLHERNDHYETFYVDSMSEKEHINQFISCTNTNTPDTIIKSRNETQPTTMRKNVSHKNFADILNIIIERKRQPSESVKGIIPVQFNDHFERYDIRPDEIISFEVFTDDQLEEEKTKLTEMVKQMETQDPKNTLKLISNNRIKEKLLQIEGQLKKNKEKPSLNLSDPTNSNRLIISTDPTNSNKVTISTDPIISKQYSFYSKKRPPLNLIVTNPIPYTPYLLQPRIRKPLTLTLTLV